jgi:hypothetical protein
LGRPQRRRRRHPPYHQVVVEGVHQVRGGVVGYRPERGDDGGRARGQKGRRESKRLVVVERGHPGGARGEDHEPAGGVRGPALGPAQDRRYRQRRWPGVGPLTREAQVRPVRRCAAERVAGQVQQRCARPVRRGQVADHLLGRRRYGTREPEHGGAGIQVAVERADLFAGSGQVAGRVGDQGRGG